MPQRGKLTDVAGTGAGYGAGCRDRTRGPLITNQVLYQLS